MAIVAGILDNPTSDPAAKGPRDPDAPTREQTAFGLSVLTGPPLGCVEMRALGVDGSHPESRFFDPADPAELARMAREGRGLARRARGVYFTLNPVHAGLLVGPDCRAASDRDILARRWFLVDIDPTRPKDCSATAAEKAAAFETARAVRDHLYERGWPAPILADSGNGWHLLFRVDLPADDTFAEVANPDGSKGWMKRDGPTSTLLRDSLRALAARFDGDGAKVDRSTWNASRITKLYGTAARKGVATPDRPHRVSRILEVPSPLQAVMPEMLRALASEAAAPATIPMVASARVKPRGIVARAVDGSDPLDRARAFLDECDPAVSGQGGHNQTLKVAVKVGPGFDLAPDDAFRLLDEGYNPRCVPPWDAKDLRRKVDEAYRVEARRGWLKDAGHGGGGIGGGNGAGAGPAGGGRGDRAKERLDDPHRLARIYLDQHAKHPHGFTLRYWLEEWHRWNRALLADVPGPGDRVRPDQHDQGLFRPRREEAREEGRPRDDRARRQRRPGLAGAGPPAGPRLPPATGLARRRRPGPRPDRLPRRDQRHHPPAGPRVGRLDADPPDAPILRPDDARAATSTPTRPGPITGSSSSISSGATTPRASWRSRNGSATCSRPTRARGRCFS